MTDRAWGSIRCTLNSTVGEQRHTDLRNGRSVGRLEVTDVARWSKICLPTYSPHKRRPPGANRRLYDRKRDKTKTPTEVLDLSTKSRGTDDYEEIPRSDLVLGPRRFDSGFGTENH